MSSPFLLGFNKERYLCISKSELARLSPQDQIQYFKRLHWRHDREQEKEKARLEGQQQGLEKGREEGQQQGQQQGREEQQQVIALNLLRRGLPADFIAETTGLGQRAAQIAPSITTSPLYLSEEADAKS